MTLLSYMPKDVDRRKRRRLPQTSLSTEQRALLALELIEGPARWPAARAAAVVGISLSYLQTARRASDQGESTRI